MHAACSKALKKLHLATSAVRKRAVCLPAYMPTILSPLRCSWCAVSRGFSIRNEKSSESTTIKTR